MNLTDMMKEASIIDHGWWKDGMLQPGKPTFDSEKEGIRKRNNVKPELEIEWGGAGPNVDLNEPAGKVQRNIPEEDMGDANPVILFARDQMNRGVMGKRLVSALKQKFAPKNLRRASDGLRKMFALEGIVGCIAVDSRGYESCRDALKAASNSPHKRSIRYVLGCSCGEPHLLPSKGHPDAIMAQSTGNAVDDFIASDNKHVVLMVSHCRSTMLPILSWQGDLDPSETDATLVEMMNVSGLPEGKYKELRDDRKNNKYASNLEMVKAAFRWLNAKQESAGVRHSGIADSPGIMLNPSDSPVDIIAQPELVDVEMGQFLEPEFEGTDEIVMDDIQPPQGDLDVSMVQDMEV